MESVLASILQIRVMASDGIGAHFNTSTSSYDVGILGNIRAQRPDQMGSGGKLLSLFVQATGSRAGIGHKLFMWLVT